MSSKAKQAIQAEYNNVAMRLGQLAYFDQKNATEREALLKRLAALESQYESFSAAEQFEAQQEATKAAEAPNDESNK